MVQLIVTGIGAGAAAAMLFASVSTGSIAATILFYLSPLPILIAALGWGHWTALLAAVVGAASLFAVLGVFFLTAFLAGVGLPAWWLGYLAMLARPATNGAGSGLEWYPPGRLVLWAAVIATLLVAAAIPAMGTDLESFRGALRSAFERALQLQTGSQPAGSELDRVIEMLVVAIPAAAGVLITLTSVVNLWLAGRIVKLSGRLQRPWPDLSALTLPPYTPGLLAVAIGGTFLPGLAGMLSSVMAAALLLVFALLGFAVLHAITRDINSRAFVRGGTYAAVVVLGWPVLAMSMLGLAETALNIRQRVATKRGPPSVRT